MIDAYLWGAGLFFNVVLAVVIIIFASVWFIWPAVEAISMVRYYKRIQFVHGVKMHNILRLFIYAYEPFGRKFTATRCSYGYWEGVGDWKVYDQNNQ